MRNFIISETLVQDNSKRINSRCEQTASSNTQNTGETTVATLTATFPPFDILLTWLKYTYQQTGEWPLPPEDSQPGQANIQDALLVKSCNIRGNQNEQSIKVKNTDANETRSKGLWVVPDTLPSQKIKAEDKVQYCSTNFDYVNSCYFAEASRLVDNYASQCIQDSLLFGCKRVLSLIIAWCRFPLFNGLSNRQGRWMVLATAHCSRELRMRVAHFRECVEELEAAGLIVTGQAGNGMIERYAFEQLRYDCTNLDKLVGTEASKYWSRQSVQTKTLVYRLGETVELEGALAAFNPFICGKDQNIELFDDRERPNTALESENTIGKDLTVAGKDPEIQTTGTDTISGSFPGVPCYDKLIHDVDDESINFFSKTEPIKDICPVENEVSTSISEIPSKSSSVFSNFALEQFGRLTLEQRAKFDFLNSEANFEGYCRKDGRATLDTQEALKFALMQNLTLEALQLRYNQVGEMWANGHCKRNPIGLLHWAIINNCDPRGYDDLEKPIPETHNQNNSRERKEGTTSSNARIAYSTTRRSSTQSNKGYSKPSRSGTSYSAGSGYESNSSQNSTERKRVKNFGQYFPPFQKLVEISDASSELEVVEGQVNETILNEIPAQTPYCLEDPVTLWRDILDYDLAGRFKLSNRELDLLVSSRLEINTEVGEGSEKQIRVVLRSAFEENQLGLTTRNVIQLAIRQKLGPGYKLFFTSAT